MSDGDQSAADRYEAFLRAERPEDILIYFHEDGVGAPETLADVSTPVEDGVVLVLSGKGERGAFERATDINVMDFAGDAMHTDGEIDDACTGGTCPDSDGSGDHYATFVFAFVEKQNEAVGGIYAEGDVMHGYASCACGTRYSEKSVLDD